MNKKNTKSKEVVTEEPVTNEEVVTEEVKSSDEQPAEPVKTQVGVIKGEEAQKIRDAEAASNEPQAA